MRRKSSTRIPVGGGLMSRFGGAPFSARPLPAMLGRPSVGHRKGISIPSCTIAIVVPYGCQHCSGSARPFTRLSVPRSRLTELPHRRGGEFGPGSKGKYTYKATDGTGRLGRTYSAGTDASSGPV
jgi:hypothetical protein